LDTSDLKITTDGKYHRSDVLEFFEQLATREIKAG